MNSASSEVLAAVRAIKNWNRWGPYAATAYAINRGATPLMMFHVMRTEIKLGRGERHA